MERRNRQDSAITSLRYRCVRNDNCLAGHDITPQSALAKRGGKRSKIVLEQIIDGDKKSYPLTTLPHSNL